MRNNQIEAWHFLPEDRRLRFGRRMLVRPGNTFTATKRSLELCAYGLHASERAYDALKYAPGPVICRVMLTGAHLRGEDKLCAEYRTVLWMADATDVLRSWARWCALQVIHLWDAPDVVRQYLETGDEGLRAAAGAAAGAAAWVAAGVAARDAAWDAARNAARDAAWDAARDAGGDAGGDAEIERYNAELETRLWTLAPGERS